MLTENASTIKKSKWKSEDLGGNLIIEGGEHLKKAPRRPKTSSSSGEPKRNRSKKSKKSKHSEIILIDLEEPPRKKIKPKFLKCKHLLSFSKYNFQFLF